MDVNYLTGYDGGYDYSGGQGSPGNGMIDSSYSNAFTAEEHVSPGTLSPSLYYHHDPMVSPSMSTLSHFSVGQHPAESQPCAAAARTTPHASNLHMYRSYPMSRGPSQISHHSSTSSSQPHGSYQSCAPIVSRHGGFGHASVTMLRSASDTSSFQAQSLSRHGSTSRLHNFSAKCLTVPSGNTNTAGISATLQYSPQDGSLDDSLNDLGWNSLAGLNSFGNSTEDFGRTVLG